MRPQRLVDRILLAGIRNHRCLVCPSVTSVVVHHVKTRKSGGDDSPSNCVELCIRHHGEIHTIGIESFANKYDLFECWLLSHGWSKILGKWRQDGRSSL